MKESVTLLLVLITLGRVAFGQTATERPNVLWINCEDIGPDLGSYGDDFATTPHLDQLAEASTLFRRAYATAPICSPSRSALITGRYATSLGTQHLRSDIERPEFIQTLPELLKDAGYFTSNYGKTDYNFDPEGLYDYQKQDLFPWRQRTEDQPFFSYFVFGMTHEGSVNFTEKWRENTKNLAPGLFHDSTQVRVPVYHPNTEAFRRCWTHYYDNITVMDSIVGQVLAGLEADGLKDNTIVFFFSDHGPGLPRYKRWLYQTGLHVPFIAYVPDRYRQRLGVPSEGENTELVSFVDFVPTVLELAGLPVPETVEGKSIWGENTPPRTHVIGARDRADNMYETGRCVIDSQFIYVRNYTPHLPYIQPGYIFSSVKESLADLHRLRAAEVLPAESERMFHPKPPEELYDLRNDPQELQNLAYLPEYQDRVKNMRAQLHDWIRRYRDTGLLPEAEYMQRAQGTTPYEMAHDPAQYPLKEVLAAAELVGTDDSVKMTAAMQHGDSGVRYWGLVASQASDLPTTRFRDDWTALLQDPSPSVQITAAEYLLHEAASPAALAVLEKWVQDERGWLALSAARSIELIGARAEPLVPTLRQVLADHRSESATGFPYRDFMFSAFISWSVKWALHHCGEEVDIRS